MNGWRDDFEGPDLDTGVWVPSYLPVWSSRADAAASYRVEDSQLILDLPVDHPLWCPEEHPTPLRVSGMMSGNHSGPVGSTVGQQSIFVGQKVREEQPRFEGFVSSGGHLEVRCSMDITPRSMAALWLCGQVVGSLPWLVRLRWRTWRRGDLDASPNGVKEVAMAGTATTSSPGRSTRRSASRRRTSG